MSGQPSGHLCRDREDRTPAPQSQPLPRRPRLHTWPLKEHPWHPSLPRALPADPASLRRAESLAQHPTPSSTPHQASLPRVGGDRQLGLWPVVLVYHLGQAFLEPDSALAIWGLCRATPFPSQPLRPCSGSRPPKTTRGRGQGGHTLVVTRAGCGLCGHRPRMRPRRYGGREGRER